MAYEPTKPTDIDTYISAFPEEIRKKLQQIRETIHAAAPDAAEAISYQIPTFKLHGNLVHFAAYQHHIGFYPSSSGIEKFKESLKEFHTSRGTVQFPHDKPIPFNLIEEIVRFRVKENFDRAGLNKKK